MTETSHREVIDLAAGSESVMLIGALDTGKTTMARKIITEAVHRGRAVAYVDADLSNTTVGPPACVGLKIIRSKTDLANLATADRLHFVGVIKPDQLVLQQVIATSVLATEGRELADLVVVDTTSSISGVVGESLKYHKTELIRPQEIIGLQRGAELEPVIGMLRRFFSTNVHSVEADPEVIPLTPDTRAARRQDHLRKAFGGSLEKWKIRPTVFSPTLPPGIDLARVNGVLVGIQDGTGRCLGLGRLESDNDELRVLTPVGEGMQGLRLGSVTLDLETFQTHSVNLREIIFGV